MGGTADRYIATLWRERTLAAIPVRFAIRILITKLKAIGARYRDGCETDVTSRAIIGLIGTAAVFHRTGFRFAERSLAGADRLGVFARIGALLATGAGAPLTDRIAWGCQDLPSRLRAVLRDQLTRRAAHAPYLDTPSSHDPASASGPPADRRGPASDAAIGFWRKMRFRAGHGQDQQRSEADWK